MCSTQHLQFGLCVKENRAKRKAGLYRSDDLVLSLVGVLTTLRREYPLGPLSCETAIAIHEEQNEFSNETWHESSLLANDDPSYWNSWAFCLLSNATNTNTP